VHAAITKPGHESVPREGDRLEAEVKRLSLLLDQLLVLAGDRVVPITAQMWVASAPTMAGNVSRAVLGIIPTVSPGQHSSLSLISRG
jgi:hypothetical protein